MMSKNSNRSLFIYTSLIFIVAIIMIVVSFFAQTHLDRTTLGTDADAVSLSDKASKVSDENMQLLEFNKTLKDDKEALEQENAVLKEDAEKAKKELDAYSALFNAANAILDGKISEAKTILSGIYTEDLTTAQKEIYDNLFKKTQ